MMLTQRQIDAIRAWPGSYNFWCVDSPQGAPYWSHTPRGHVLHEVTEIERQIMRDRSLRLA